MATLYVIPNWEKDFENSKSRQVENATFFCVPNNFDGRLMRRLQKLNNAPELYGSFHAICAIASRCPYRGVLLNERGPLDAIEISEKSGFKVKYIARALNQLSSPVIGLLEKHEIEEIEGEWPLPVAVCRWAIHRSARRRAASDGVALCPSPTPSDTERHRTESKTLPRSGDIVVAAHSSASLGSPPGTPSDTERHRATRREGKRREYPPTVPQGGQEFLELPHPEKEKLVEEAKRRVCSFKTFAGKNPTRPWSRDAMDELTKRLPIPDYEWRAVEWLHSFSDDDRDFDLKRRRRTETSLFTFWGDEVSLALAYAKKQNLVASGSNGSKKKEPERWREFLKWKNGPDVVLPDSFYQLEYDQQSEYARDFETFEKAGEAAS